MPSPGTTSGTRTAALESFRFALRAGRFGPNRETGTLPAAGRGLSLQSRSILFGCSAQVIVGDGRCGENLTDDDFTYDGTDYAIDFLYLQKRSSSDDRFYISFDTALTPKAQTLVLDVAGTKFQFQHGEVQRRSARWNTPSLNWTAGDTVVLKLFADTTVPRPNNVVRHVRGTGKSMDISFSEYLNEEAARQAPVGAFRVEADGSRVPKDSNN